MIYFLGNLPPLVEEIGDFPFVMSLKLKLKIYKKLGILIKRWLNMKCPNCKKGSITLLKKFKLTSGKRYECKYNMYLLIIGGFYDKCRWNVR